MINIYKGKGEDLNRENERGLKLLQHGMRVLKCVVKD